MIISTYGSTKIMPFEQKSSKLPMYKYEGFEEKEGEEEEKEEKKEGYENADTVKPNSVEPLCAKYNDTTFKTIDIYSTQDTDPNNCKNISNGLSKSTGYLCPTEEVQKLQRTRGGNSSGAPHQIGA
jgi:hypothetical protein